MKSNRVQRRPCTLAAIALCAAGLPGCLEAFLLQIEARRAEEHRRNAANWTQLSQRNDEPHVVVRMLRLTPAGMCTNSDAQTRDETTDEREVLDPEPLRGNRATRSSSRVRRLSGTDCTTRFEDRSVRAYTFTVNEATDTIDGRVTTVFPRETTLRVTVGETFADTEVRVGDARATALEFEFLSHFLMLKRDYGPSIMRDGSYRIGHLFRGSMNVPMDFPWSGEGGPVAVDVHGGVRQLLGTPARNYEIYFAGRRDVTGVEHGGYSYSAARAMRVVQPIALDANEVSNQDSTEWTARGVRAEEGLRYRYFWRRSHSYAASFTPWFAGPSAAASTVTLY
ncbi:MAG: hypothetical protein JNK05_34500 [Myxococcales bacterium]|nr:hypothetical protein [Myxococcales bacterium]